MQVHSVHDVFTPSSTAGLTFVERNTINDRLVDSLRTQGKQLVVYGHSGCGKTTLLENKLKQLFSVAHVRTPCMKGMTFEQILAHPLRHLGTKYQSEISSKSTEKIGSSLSTAAAFAASAQLTGERQNESSDKFAAVVAATPTPQLVAETLGKLGACWVLEDFHKIAPEEKEKLAQCMKMFVDFSQQYPDLKMIFIGAVHSGREVIQYEPELRQRVAEIHVPLMTPPEIRQILFLGESHLNIKFDARVIESIVAMSNGLAAVAHQLSLHFCLARGIETTRHNTELLDTGKLRTAIQRYLEDSQDTLRAAFEKSVRNLKKRKYDHGRLILKAMTKLPQEGGTYAEVFAKVRSIEPLYPKSALTQHINILKSDDRGRIITLDESSGNYYFSEPVHRAFCYSLFEVESQRRALPSSAVKWLNIEQTLRELIPEIAQLITKQQLHRDENNGGNGSNKPSKA